MITFESINHFVDHYKEKKTIPSTANIIINGVAHLFERETQHNKDKIDTAQWDKYMFREVDSISYGIGIRLYANYFRYLEDKVLFEVFFEIGEDSRNKWFRKLICPIYFYDRFITDEDYVINATKGTTVHSEILEKWTSLKFINANVSSIDFINHRLNAFDKLLKELYAKTVFQRKNKPGNYKNFKLLSEVPNSWFANDEIE
jgi:hypothetical protein